MDSRRWLAKTTRRCRRRVYDASLRFRLFCRRLARPGGARGYAPRHFGGGHPGGGRGGAVISGLAFPAPPEITLARIYRKRAIRRATGYYVFLALVAAVLLAYRVNPELPGLARKTATACLGALAEVTFNLSVPTASTSPAGLAAGQDAADVSGRESLPARSLLSRSIPQMSEKLGVAAQQPPPAEQAGEVLDGLVSTVTGIRFSRPETLLAGELGGWPRWFEAAPASAASEALADISAQPAPTSSSSQSPTAISTGRDQTASRGEESRASQPNDAPASNVASSRPGTPDTSERGLVEKSATSGTSAFGAPRTAIAGLPPSTAAVANLGRELATNLRAIDFGSKPLILIYHTHSSEAYHGRMSEHDKALDYSQKGELGVLSVGDIITSVLRERYRIPVTHSRRFHDIEDLRGAYGRSKATLLESVKAYPSLVMTVDVHRDGVPTKQSPPESLLVQKVAGSGVARVQILVGKGDPARRYNPNWRQNLALAQILNQKLESLHPGLSRGIVVRDDWPYNMELFSGALLVEVGDHYNALDEAQRAAVLVADAIAATLGELAQRRTPPMLRRRL